MRKDSKRILTNAKTETSGVEAFENPLDFIAEDHMREREVCALIDKLVSSENAEDFERRQILGFLEETLPQHLADEEIDLFPLMLKRCDPEDEIEKMINKLQSDHEHAMADAPGIVGIIQSNMSNATQMSEHDRRLLMDFAHHSRRHLILENAVILPIARVRLRKRDLSHMKKQMLARRRAAANG